MTRILPEDLDYTARDFDALGERLDRSIESVFPQWTDKSKANFGNILKECVQFVGDVFGYYEDSHAIESRFTTATQRINGIRHARALNYRFDRQEAATADLTITLRQTWPKDVVVVAGDVVRTSVATDPPRFQLTQADTIPTGSLELTGVPCENSITYPQFYESDDLANQTFVLEQIPFLSLVSMADGVGGFSEVDNFLESGPTDSHVVILATETGQAKVIFGDGNQGRRPEGTVTTYYKTGGGGVIAEAGTLEVPEFQLYDTDGDPVPFDITNPLRSVGGLDQETLANAQRQAPALLLVNQRSVTWSDYSTVAKTVGGVARALMLTSDQLSGLAENFGQLYVAAQGEELASGAYLPAPPTSQQLIDVAAAVANEYPPTLTFTFDVLGYVANTIDITARVRLQQGASAAAVDTAIRDAFKAFFSVVDASGNDSELIQFGFQYRDELGQVDARVVWSDLFAAVLAATGVRSVDEDSFLPADDVVLQYNELPVLGTVTIINDRTGQELI